STTMKKTSSIIAAAAVLFFSACNNSGKEKEEAKTKDTIAATKAPEQPAATPLTVVVVQHPVKNFDKWKPLFDGHDSVRKAYGLTVLGVGRGLDNPNMVYVMMKANDVQKAKDFAQSPNLKETMQKAGVTAAPTVSYLTVVRSDTTTIPIKERVMVSHHVKDFDAWLKVYDAEGKETRAANGLIDRGLARGVDDPNMVYLLFAVSDRKKAKARFGSPELKKIMTDAGVDSKPDAHFYKVVD
ncbi:MAG TPA: hypothetical protein VET23_00970, partial [Chitinophagaceae bacterium]|nr:hypothetical protein [Chitinophagaceae bacterium]